MKKNIEVIEMLNKVQDYCAFLKKQVYAPEGIRITLLNHSSCSLIELWDANCPAPQITFISGSEMDPEIMVTQLQRQLNSLNPNNYGRTIEVYSEIPKDLLNENYQKFLEVMNIQFYEEVDPEYINIIKEREDVKNHLQSE